MNLDQWIRFEDVLEPDVWDVVPEVHLSSYAVHVKCMPWFAHPKDQNFSGLNWEIVEDGCIYGEYF